jgi:hypothetical protein
VAAGELMANFDTLVLPPGFVRALAESKPADHLNLFGMKVIESPMAYRTRLVPDRLQRSRTFPFQSFEITYKEVREPVALLFNTAALGYRWPLPPIRKSDLSTFQSKDYGVIDILTGAAG